MRILTVTLLTSLLFYACNKDDCTGKTTISYATMEDFGGVSCGLDTSAYGAGMNFVVVDASTMEDLLACDSMPEIDFNKYTLLIGTHVSETDLSYKDQAVIRDCETRMVTCQISFDSEGLDTSMLVRYHAIIPRVPEGYVIDFAIKIWQSC